jgi:hypothetical protein
MCMNRRLLLCIAALSALVLSLSPASGQALVVTQKTWTLSGQTARGWIATVKLTDPSVEIVVTSPTPTGTPEANLLATDLWHTQSGNKVSINANFFGKLTDPAADIIGLSVTDGTVVSPIRQFGATPDPAIMFRADRTAQVGFLSNTDAQAAWDAVAGVGPSNTDTVPGTLLVTDGVNTGATARVDPLNRNPRTALGLNQAGDTLIIIEVDGRQTGWSVGMTLPELADALLQAGAYRAVNLDGGGSSAFIYTQDNGTVVKNRPSDGTFRPVANHLGIKINAASSQYRNTRPIRGAKLRPPETLTGVGSLDESLANLCRAGITDVFLETFYWGVTTGGQGTFNARFGYNYLNQAIKLAARYGQRVHAWCEMGYWQYQSVGAYNFTVNPPGQSQGNPAWKVAHITTPSITGDAADQVFANLAHPGVRSKLVSYVGELASEPGLWSIFADYCRFPVDNNTADSYTAPWSYDTWSRQTFQAAFGSDPLTSAATPTGSQWNNFVSWRRTGITQTVGAMYQAIKAANPTMLMAVDVPPAAATNSAQFAKMQDWPSWAASNFCDVVSPMCYSSTTTSIASEIQTARSLAAGKPLWVALALTGSASHPGLTSQLDTAKINGAEDIAIFKADVFSDAALRTELATWLNANATRQRGDFNNDGYVDARDRSVFLGIFSGTPVTVTGRNSRLNYNGDTVIDQSDWTAFSREFSRARFGEDGVVDHRDLTAFLQCLGSTSVTAMPAIHLYDLDGDSDVDYADQLILHALLTVPVAPDTDVDQDGDTEINDLYALNQNLNRDVNRDGIINSTDIAALENVLKAMN